MHSCEAFLYTSLYSMYTLYSHNVCPYYSATFTHARLQFFNNLHNVPLIHASLSHCITVHSSSLMHLCMQNTMHLHMQNAQSGACNPIVSRQQGHDCTRTSLALLASNFVHSLPIPPQSLYTLAYSYPGPIPTFSTGQSYGNHMVV